MRTNSLLSLLLASAFLATSCSGDKSHHNHDEHDHASEPQAVAEPTKPQFEVDKEFQNQLSAVFSSYTDLQEALVASDAEKAKKEASKTADLLAKVDMTLVTGAAHNDWMNYLGSMDASLKAIQTQDDLEEQRKSFSQLSDNLYKSIKAFGIGGDEAYYTYCPMAFNDQGGYWLSDDQKIRNPYFGDKMLTCGTVKETLR